MEAGVGGSSGGRAPTADGSGGTSSGTPAAAAFTPSINAKVFVPGSPSPVDSSSASTEAANRKTERRRKRRQTAALHKAAARAEAGAANGDNARPPSGTDPSTTTQPKAKGQGEVSRASATETGERGPAGAGSGPRAKGRKSRSHGEVASGDVGLQRAVPVPQPGPKSFWAALNKSPPPASAGNPPTAPPAAQQPRARQEKKGKDAGRGLDPAAGTRTPNANGRSAQNSSQPAGQKQATPAAAVKGEGEVSRGLPSADDFPSLGQSTPGMLRLNNPLGSAGPKHPRQPSKEAQPGKGAGQQPQWPGKAAAQAQGKGQGHSRPPTAAAAAAAPPAPKPVGAGQKPPKQPANQPPPSDNLGDLVLKMLSQPSKKKGKAGKGGKVHISSSLRATDTGGQSAPSEKKRPALLDGKKGKVAGNVLDSSAPVKLRGKERATPKRKKPTALKQKILEERGVRKSHRELEQKRQAWMETLDPTDCRIYVATQTLTRHVAAVHAALRTLDGRQPPRVRSGAASAQDIADPVESLAGAQGQDPDEGQREREEGAVGDGGEAEAEEEESPEQRIARLEQLGRFPRVKAMGHSRKFREYCTQVKDPELNKAAAAFLERLLAFQTRLHLKDPVKARSRRRFVVGFREVSKLVDRGKARCVIVAPDIERIQIDGGLDDMVGSIVDKCKEQDLQVFFCLPRRQLGRVLHKKVAVSVVGIRDYQGAEDLFEVMLQRADAASEAYANRTQAEAATIPPP